MTIEGFTEKDERIMRRAVRSEFKDPLSPIAGPDWQAAITDYLQRGGQMGKSEICSNFTAKRKKLKGLIISQ